MNRELLSFTSPLLCVCVCVCSHVTRYTTALSPIKTTAGRPLASCIILIYTGVASLRRTRESDIYSLRTHARVDRMAAQWRAVARLEDTGLGALCEQEHAQPESRLRLEDRAAHVHRCRSIDMHGKWSTCFVTPSNASSSGKEAHDV